MKLSLMIIVVLRLFAINWAVAGIVSLMTSFGLIGYGRLTGAMGVLQAVLPFLQPTAYGLLAFLAWRFAGWISAKAIGEHDTEVRMSEITPENLYTLGILGFGLYYFLGYLAGMINWIHYLAANRAGDYLMYEQQGLSLYDVSSQVIPCVAGAAIAMLSPKMARKLANAGSQPNKALLATATSPQIESESTPPPPEI